MNISWPWNSAFTFVRLHGIAECTDLYICKSDSRTETCFKKDETCQIFKSLQLSEGCADVDKSVSTDGEAMLLHTTAHSVYLHVQMTPGSSKVSSINMPPIRLACYWFSILLFGYWRWQITLGYQSSAPVPLKKCLHDNAMLSVKKIKA